MPTLTASRKSRSAGSAAATNGHLDFEVYPAPRPFKLPRKLKIIVVVMVACAVFGLVALAAASKKSQSPSGLKYQGFATLMAQNFVAGTKVNAPVASGLPQDLGRQAESSVSNQQNAEQAVQPLGVAQLAFASGSDSTSKKGGTVETDYFWLQYESGTLGQLAVVVRGTSSGPVLAAIPTLLATAQGGSGDPVETGENPSDVSSQLPHTVLSQIAQWAKAYAANDQANLHEYTGDQSGRTYIGLGGYTVVGAPTVVSVTPFDANKMPSELPLTIQMTLQSTTNSKIVTEVQYDLLITNLTAAFPNIAAWGPPGSGPSLKPYQNAL